MIVTEWECGENRAAQKFYLSVPVAINTDGPGMLYIRDGITKERVSEIYDLDAGAHALSIKLTKPTRFVEWVVTNIKPV